MRLSKPPWLKVRPPGGTRYAWIKSRARARGLHTVCEEAQCPNIGECWAGGTATFMVMGDTCTRGCRFCAVNTKRDGLPLDPDEPQNLAKTIAQMQLDYVVVTSVNRDDLPNQGARHFAACIHAIHEAAPQTLVEVLIPDFRGDTARVRDVVEARPAVVAHNIECVERLTPVVRDPRATFQQSLDVLASIKKIDPSRRTKSSIMVGVGESAEEVVAAMRALRTVDTDFLTIGQYLQPSARHLPVDTYVHPDTFAHYREVGEALGFGYVASGPLVRSSYRAGEFYIRRHIEQTPGRFPSEGVRP